MINKFQIQIPQLSSPKSLEIIQQSSDKGIRFQTKQGNFAISHKCSKLKNSSGLHLLLTLWIIINIPPIIYIREVKNSGD